MRGPLQVPRTTVDRIKATIYQMLMTEILTFNERENTWFLNKFLRITVDRIKATIKYANNRVTDL